MHMHMHMRLHARQMTGYMFRNAEYRRSLSESLSAAESGGGVAVEMGALPAVSGTVSVEIAEGMKAEVDAAAYMAELRSEVEGLRAQLTVRRTRPNAAAPPHRRTAATAAPPPPRHPATATPPSTQVAKEKQAGAGVGMIQYVQSLPTEEAQELTSQVSKEVLDAMGQLITSLLKEADVQPDAVMETSDLKMRELLVWQVRVLSTQCVVST